MNAKRIWGIVLTVLSVPALLRGCGWYIKAYDVMGGPREDMMFQAVGAVIAGVILLAPGIFLIVSSREGTQRRTVLIKAELAKVYKKCFQWLGLQGYDISEQVKNERIVAKTRKANMALSFEKTEEGTFLVAEASNEKGMEQFSQLLGILSLLNE